DRPPGSLRRGQGIRSRTRGRPLGIGGIHRSEIRLCRLEGGLRGLFMDQTILTNDLEVIDRARVFHPSTHLAQFARGEAPSRIVTGGRGVSIVDRDGRKSIDAFAGLYCVNVGYGRTEIAEAIQAQAGKLAYYHAYAGHSNEQIIRLSERIIAKAGLGMSRIYYGLSGSDANETNIKLVWYYNNILARPAKKKIISRWRGYHGS